MAREIKFRAWWVNDKQMDSWDEILNGDIEATIRIYFKPDDNFPMVLMQFTGLKDTNGKDVYEGDYLAVWESGSSGSDRHTYEVVWCGGNGYFAFDLEDWPSDEMNGLSDISESGDWEFEVVGNIYENAKLLNH